VPRRAAGLRVGWTVLDQGLSSLTNFGLSVLVARFLSPEKFGTFAVLYAGYLFAVGASRALNSEPLLVRHTDREHGPSLNAVASSTGAALLVGSVILVGCVIGAAFGGGAALLALGLSMPGLLLQDAWRYGFFSTGRPARAAANDALWAVLQLTFVGVLVTRYDPSVAALILTWGASATICAVVGIAQGRLRPAPEHAVSWFRDHRDLAPRYFGEFVTAGGAQQIVLWLVGIVGGLAAAGAVRGAQVLFGPITVLLVAAPAAMIAEGVRLYRRDRTLLIRALAAVAAVLAIATLGWGVVLLLLPASTGQAIVGDTWESARPLILPLTVNLVASSVATGALVGLRVLQEASRSFRLRVAFAPLMVSAAMIGLLIGDALGAVVGMATVACVAAVVWWIQFLRAAASPRRLVTDEPDEPVVAREG
jgi:O-antigen/teichoic acid export membrane protein